jgi:hypothetical protein
MAMYSRIGRAVGTLAVAGTLAGCTQMPLMSLLKIAQTDLSSTDLSRMRAAVKLPRGIEPRPAGVALRIGVRLANGHEEFQDFVLREVTAPSEVNALQSEVDSKTHIFAYRLDQRLGTFRDELKRKQQQGGGRGGSLTIAIQPDACRTTDLPEGPIYYDLSADSGDRELCTALARCRSAHDQTIPGRGGVAARMRPPGGLRRTPM